MRGVRRWVVPALARRAIRTTDAPRFRLPARPDRGRKCRCNRGSDRAAGPNRETPARITRSAVDDAIPSDAIQSRHPGVRRVPPDRRARRPHRRRTASRPCRTPATHLPAPERRPAQRQTRAMQLVARPFDAGLRARLACHGFCHAQACNALPVARGRRKAGVRRPGRPCARLRSPNPSRCRVRCSACCCSSVGQGRR